jgi:hypothetical protein
MAVRRRQRRTLEGLAGAVVRRTSPREAISAITRFGDNGVLPYFGLPRTLPV